MARSRTIRPEFWNDEKLAKVSRDARLLFIGIWTCSDDYGVTKGNDSWLKSQIFPYEDSVKLDKFISWMNELENLKVIIPFQFHLEKFYYIKNFSKHQKVDHPSKNRNPEPPKDIESPEYRYSPDSNKKTNRPLSPTLANESRDFRVEYKQNINRVKTETISSSSDFDEFWSAYPKERRVGKLAAKKAWSKQNGNRPPTEIILQKIEQLKQSHQWQSDNGKYIPNPATWINRGGWDDELPISDQCPGFDWKEETANAK